MSDQNFPYVNHTNKLHGPLELIDTKQSDEQRTVQMFKPFVDLKNG